MFAWTVKLSKLSLLSFLVCFLLTFSLYSFILILLASSASSKFIQQNPINNLTISSLSLFASFYLIIINIIQNSLCILYLHGKAILAHGRYVIVSRISGLKWLTYRITIQEDTLSWEPREGNFFPWMDPRIIRCALP